MGLNAVTLYLQKGEKRRREREEIFIRLYVTIYSIVTIHLINITSKLVMQVEPLPLPTVAVIRVLQFVQVAV